MTYIEVSPSPLVSLSFPYNMLSDRTCSCGVVVVIIAAQFSTNTPQLTFYEGSNPARGVAEIYNGKNF